MKKNQQGSALLEALISILIFSMGILANVGLQSAMIKDSINSQYRAEAAFLSNELLGIIWSDKNSLSSYAIAAGQTTSTYPLASTWLTKVQQTLPAGAPIVAINGSEVTITVTWKKGNEPTHQYSISSNVTP